MTDNDVARDGGCRCGNLRFRVTAAPLVTMACHCRECQHMTASAFSLSMAIPQHGFAVVRGDPVIGGKPSPDLQHFHCPSCKSWVFTRITGVDFFVNVRATMLDEPGAWASPFVETYTSEKLAWATTPAVHAFPRLPPPEAWEGLMRDYRAQADQASTPPLQSG